MEKNTEKNAVKNTEKNAVKNTEKNIDTQTAKKSGEGKKSFIQLIKFALVGGMNTLVDMVISTLVSFLLGLTGLTGGWMIYVSKAIGYSCGILNSYIFNSRWTFKKERRQDAREIISFIAVNLFVLAISFGLIYLFKDVLHIGDKWMALNLPAWFAKIINGERACMLLSTVICIFVNFIGNKLFVFKRGAKENDAGKIKPDAGETKEK